MSGVLFKEASTVQELEQLHRLNYQTFAEELGQYPTNINGVLVDRFHTHNRYFIAVEDDRIVGMISIHNQAPFSVEKRLPHGGEAIRQFRDPCEVRQLAICQEARHGMILAGLFWQVYAEAKRQGRSHMLISGVTERQRMYRSLGFQSLGPPVADGETSFIPMAMDLEDEATKKKASRFVGWWDRRPRREIKLLPGPVQIAENVREAFEQLPVSHREQQLVAMYGDVRKRLSMLAGGMPVAVMTGSGTLANDAVAACLRSRFGNARGLVLTNGEFGERLMRQARRAGLRFANLMWNWGETWELDRIEHELDRGPAWVWGVHLETSTGQLNDIKWLSSACRQRGIEVAADCVSSLGAVSMEGLNLSYASGVSGKSLGAYAGLCFVFVAKDVLKKIKFEEMPLSFDLAMNIIQNEPLFTLPSPQLRALDAALSAYYNGSAGANRRFEHYRTLSEWVRQELMKCGLRPLVGGDAAAPVICSFELPDDQAISRWRSAGFLVAHESGYLRDRGWAQISVMGDLDAEMIRPFFAAEAATGADAFQESEIAERL